MLQVIIAGVLMGMIGSFHCVGMCGPLALSLPVSNLQSTSKVFGLLLYNFGRVVSYTFLGLIIGIFGNSLQLVGLQKWVSVLTGAAILMIFIFRGFQSSYSNRLLTPLFEIIRKKLGELYFRKSLSTLFLIGLLNGFLPCGFVYLAFASALSASDVYGSIVFMGSFGLGTIPMMWSLVFFGSFIHINIQRRIKKLYPYAMLIIACLLIVRGLGLGIPYFSPAVELNKGAIHSCCHK